MKLEPRRVDSFLADPGSIRAALLFGDDAGLIADRASRLTRAVAGAADDPFRVIELERDGFGRIAAEMAELALTGGRRVVRVRDASDAATAAVEAALTARLPAFLVLEAPGLGARSRLRAAIEASADAVAIGCYPLDAASMARVIRAGLQEDRVEADPEALAWLEARLGGDLAATRGEIEKLVLYAGPGGKADLAAVQACVGDVAGLSLEDALFAATEGDAAAADRALELTLGEGMAPVAVLRAALNHMHRLYRAQLAMREGATAAQAAKAVRPPLFFRREAAFTRALQRWPHVRLGAAAAALALAESACKRTGAPAETLCRSVMLGVALNRELARG